MSNPTQGAATRERNEEIERRLTAGESGPDLARAFGITQPRVFQIARAVREARGEVAPRAKPIRPRLRKDDLGLWECTDGTVSRRGETQKDAYDRWMKAALAGHVAGHLAPYAGKATPKPEQPYSGPVTVVPGMRPGRPLTLSPAMQLASARALAAQPRMHSLSGGRRGGE
ncbi:hypothetical protein ACNPPY_00170 [Achromobacter sp. AGC78]